MATVSAGPPICFWDRSKSNCAQTVGTKGNSNLGGGWRGKGPRGAWFAGAGEGGLEKCDYFFLPPRLSPTNPSLPDTVARALTLHCVRENTNDAHTCVVLLLAVRPCARPCETSRNAAVRGLLRRARRPSESGSTRSPGVSGVRRRRQGRTSVPAALVNVYCGGVTNLP